MSLFGMETHPQNTVSASEFAANPRLPGRPLAGKRCHFIGAGGIGMSGLAKVLIRNGAAVAGSDMEDSHVVRHLCAMGATIHVGHRPENFCAPCDAVVISAAVQDANPELQAARAAGATVYKYAEMLGELMDLYKGVAVCGTHGKSTTSGWLAHLLTQAGTDPSYIVGADIPQLAGSSGVGRTGGVFVAEACEYDRSFLNLHPQIGVILNVEQDHLDYYADEDEIVEAFCDFAANIRPGGALIANGCDRNVARVIARCRPDVKVVTFGLDDDCDYHPANVEVVDGLHCFDVVCRGKTLGRVGIAIPGEHNIANALAVIAAAGAAGVGPEQILEHVGEFSGIDRRLMLKDQFRGVTVLDDYAHHPTEIRASLQAIRQRFRPKRLWCVFQPHQYSRTRFLLDDFAESFKLADITIVPEIYFVRDTAESKKMVNAEVLVERIRSRGSEAAFIPDFASIIVFLKNCVGPGDLVVTMGAGPIWKVADEYIHWLRENR